ncbi:LacI family DNA-binding transcriptional regulator [Amycolatopsis aidingensis]|uniref:LacI family DNA-binding transcriptional regulator n=1 Tax=Amycolatopsis aidingensis TaxID=2842453 RepID=UPI001C0E031A|nr:LacI family DNA-binding transcriptional regulator [Amycolatopsis aidingensis]
MTRSGSRRPTLAAIAQAAGVSLPTASKVLNGKDDVSAETRARVRRLLEEHEYIPVGTRRAAAGQVVIDLVFTALDSPWAVEIIRGVVDSGVQAVVSAMAHRKDWAQTLVRARRAGAVLVTSELSKADLRLLERARLPLVVLDPADLPSPDVPSVGATNWAGGLAATEHLLELGHRRIAVIGGPPGFLCSKARIDGYRTALERAGGTAHPELIRHGDFHHEGGYRAAVELLDLPDPPTAIFAGSDEQALGAIEAARRAGLTVPREVSVVGFDDLPVARWSSPPLTTIRQPLDEMGRLAGRLLADLIAGTPPRSHRIELATELIVRSTTAPPAR